MKLRKTACLTGLAFAAALVAAGPAWSQGMRRGAPAAGYVYGFGEYDYYSASGGSLNGGGLGLGWRLSRYFALEGGGQYASKSGVNIMNGYAQGLFVFPVSNSFNLTASLGGSYLRASTKFGVTSVSASSSGYRAGIGAEYWMSPAWGLRVGLHRQNAGGVADDISAGIAFRF